MNYFKLTSKTTIAAFAGVMLSATAANALIYNITDVLGGGGGLGATVFHAATSNGGKSGTILQTADNSSAISGFYNTVTKQLEYSFGLLNGGGTVSGAGTLDFTVASGQSLGTIVTTFTNAPGGISPAQTVFNIQYLNFNYGIGAISGAGGNANSFNILGANAFLTLWGADGTPTGNVGNFNVPALLGSDIRFALTEDPGQISVVPLPAALPLYGAGLALMGFIGWRRKRNSAA